jgi:RNA polymerase sigma factor (sigma-70 family)
MRTESLTPLLYNLCHGDTVAAQQVFVACQPYLRAVVRRRLPARLRAKFDSVDVVQSVWADLLDGYRAGTWHFENVGRLQAFLVQVTRNRFHDKFRKHRRAYEHEQSLAGLHTSEMPAAADAQPGDIAEAEDLWQRMLNLCPAEHRELLRLKREGVPMEELVVRTGLHPGSIRRVFRNLARRLALHRTT